MDPTDLRAGLASRLANGKPIDAETFNMACFMLTRSLEDLEFSTPEAAPLVRLLLRVAGRVVIDTAMPESTPESWERARDMAVQWIDEALAALGYQAVPKT